MPFVIGIVSERVWLCGLPPRMLWAAGDGRQNGRLFCCRRRGGDFCVMNLVVNSCVSFEPMGAILAERGQISVITIDYKDRRPLYQQLMERIEELAMRGLIQPDEQLPSVRSLAVELAINPNTIQRAYGELEKRGVVYSVPGRGSFLASGQDALRSLNREKYREELAEIAAKARRAGVTRGEFLADAAAVFDEGGSEE